MNSTIKKKWVDALRSGEYEQATGTLKDNNGFCCLGVLCDLYLKENNKEWVHHPNENRCSIEDSYEILPLNVSNWAYLGDLDPYFYEENQKQFLTYLNDNGYDFNRIADLIEENF